MQSRPRISLLGNGTSPVVTTCCSCLTVAIGSVRLNRVGFDHEQCRIRDEQIVTISYGTKNLTKPEYELIHRDRVGLVTGWVLSILTFGHISGKPVFYPKNPNKLRTFARLGGGGGGGRMCLGRPHRSATALKFKENGQSTLICTITRWE